VTPSPQDIQAWLVAQVSALTGIPPESLDPREPVSHSGLDSVTLVTLSADLENWLGYRFQDNPFEDHPTIEGLSRFLAEQIAGSRTRGDS